MKDSECNSCQFAPQPIWKDIVGGIIVRRVTGLFSGLVLMQNTVSVNSSDISTLKKVNETEDARAIRIENKLDQLTLMVAERNHQR